MNKKHFFCWWCLAALIAVCAVGCSTRTVFLEGARPFPVEPQFTIEPHEYSQEDLAAVGIRTDGVYVRTGWRPAEVQAQEEAMCAMTGRKTGSPFYRFWPNGRVMRRLPPHADDISLKHAESFDRARLGYYHILTNGIIETEFFRYDPGQGSFAYLKNYRTIEGDTIWSDIGEQFKGDSVQLGYHFVPIPGMSAQPDW